MPTVLFANFWGDFYTVGGFWVGVVSFVVGVMAFDYTIHQVRKTQSAAQAAKQAAEATLEENKRVFRKFVAAHANRIFGELRLLVGYEKWEAASLRGDDLAEALSRMPAADVVNLVIRVRDMANRFRLKAKVATTPFTKKNWNDLLRDVHQVLDLEMMPFDQPEEGGS